MFFSTILLLCSCAAKHPYYKDQESVHSLFEAIPESSIDYELYLVGNIGTNTNNIGQEDIVDLIKSELIRNEVKKSVVFLGNSFSETGLPDTDFPEFNTIDRSIAACIQKLKENTDKVYFIPGNTEWFDGQDHTVASVSDVEEFLESKVNGKNIFVPSNGCGEPKVVELTDDLLLVLMDSQWVLQGDDSLERKRSGCDVDGELELITYLQEILSKNKNKNVIIAAHHPVYSNGLTGGNVGLKNHILPLPILGSLIAGVKKLNGGQQAFGHPQYEAYRSVIDLALSNFEGVIHTSAHDQNLQYIEKKDNHFVIAGSGSNVDFVRKGGMAQFAAMQKGFAKITHTKDLELWLEFFIPDQDDKTKARSIYKKLLYKKKVIDYSDKTIYKDLENYPSSVETQASKKYADKKLGMGNTYRAEWSTKINAPVFLLDKVYGGLQVVQQGGGFQTKSLRLENKEGQQWVLRSVDKASDKLVPPPLRGTFIQDIVQDGFSTAHPYGAFVIPQLAEAANIYHANPTYVWLPRQKALGDYNLDFGDRLYLFEERPGGNMLGHPTYGGAKKSINTPELIQKLSKNHKHIVDQKHVLRARLFDLLIGDWDRHGDQWRWGIYEDEQYPEAKVYRAIPRDRDQVFFKNDGVLNYISSLPYFNPALRKFDYDLKDVSGLAFNARHFDRHFISQMTEADFVETAELLQKNITDQVIRNAFTEWPDDIYKIRGDEIIAKLISRRAQLVDFAKEYYRYLSKEVTVIGTKGKNVFDITALSGDQLLVEAYHIDDDIKHKVWSRTIEGEDTDELRLYGLKKDDVFNFYGQESSSIDIKLVGGSGDDVVNNQSKHLNIMAYDKKDGMFLSGKKVKSKLKDQRGINRFDRLDWKLNRMLHFPLIAFYTDEGLGLSYNLWWIKNGFRKNPYKSNHKLSLGYYFANSALAASYSGHWPSVFGPKWDFRLNATATGPTFIQFFYGLGNSYVDFEREFPNQPEATDASFHIVRGHHYDLNPNFERDLGNNRTLSVNPSLEYYNLDNAPDDINESRFIFLEEANRVDSDFDAKLYAGLGLQYVSTRLNSATLPTRGYVLNGGLDYKQSVTDTDFSNLTFSTNISAYLPFSPTHRVVLASNIGGAYTFGDYEFFHANYLSSRSRLRGFRFDRFAGDGIVYNSNDLRVNLFQGKGGLKAGLGIFGSFDIGRAFLEDEDVNDWHTSYGGGIYFTPLNLIGFRLGYFVGNEDAQFTIGGALSF
jgi:hypothetical protein